MTDVLERKPKTHKGRMMKERLRPKVQEGPRGTLFLRGTKASAQVQRAAMVLVG